jgi:hypothetical protein
MKDDLNASLQNHFKCEHPGCNKQFKAKYILRRHKAAHYIAERCQCCSSRNPLFDPFEAKLVLEQHEEMHSEKSKSDSSHKNSLTGSSNTVPSLVPSSQPMTNSDLVKPEEKIAELEEAYNGFFDAMENISIAIRLYKLPNFSTSDFYKILSDYNQEAAKEHLPLIKKEKLLKIFHYLFSNATMIYLARFRIQLLNLWKMKDTKFLMKAKFSLQKF